jgi:hypothetical protein
MGWCTLTISRVKAGSYEKVEMRVPGFLWTKRALALLRSRVWALFAPSCMLWTSHKNCYFGTAHLPPKPPPWRPHRHRPFSTTTTPPAFKLCQTILPYLLDCLPRRLFQRYSLSVLTAPFIRRSRWHCFWSQFMTNDDPIAIAHSLPCKHRRRINRSFSNLATLSLADSPSDLLGSHITRTTSSIIPKAWSEPVILTKSMMTTRNYNVVM